MQTYYLHVESNPHNIDDMNMYYFYTRTGTYTLIALALYISIKSNSLALLHLYNSYFKYFSNISTFLEDQKIDVCIADKW